ncbi:hypothetical protein UlMin_040546 [Ulmus minor]
MVPILLFFLIVLSHLVLLCPAQEKPHHQGCPPFQCGDSCIRFPFRSGSNPECGLYPVNCTGQIQKVQLKEGGHWYGFKSISTGGELINIYDTELNKSLHLGDCESIKSFSFPIPSVISNVSTQNSLTLFNCSRNLDFTHHRELNYAPCGDYRIYYPLSDTNASSTFPPECSRIQLPSAIPDQNHNHAFKFSSNFTLAVVLSRDCLNCYRRRGGQCRLDSENKFICFVLNAYIAIYFAGLGVLLVTLCCLRKKLSSNTFNFFWRRHNKTHQNVEAFLRNYGPLQDRRYRYSDIKKMTNSFTEKLGKGGFGDVYKGKLDDGCLVAVKVLNTTKGSNAEEFINEVATISRTSHVNIVSLVGFCFESAKKRALIFEFMPNGSLEKFIFDENYQLDWETHYQISLGIARGLEYLHRGCNTRILHFDIKPHNILLDADFVPKISDFGLAKICARKESIVSMMGPRGTIGYIAPEVFSRNFGGVSYKSDVYSYGMMVLEMVGGRKNINVQVDNTSEIYFPHWIYRQLEIDEDLGMKRIMNEEDRVKLRKMIIVSLWCIQTDPSTRPTMSRVIEMLEGSLESLQVPPKPFLSSPPRSPPTYSSSTFVSEQI